MKNSKRLITLALAVILVVSLIAIPVSAANTKSSFSLRNGAERTHSLVTCSGLFGSTSKIKITNNSSLAYLELWFPGTGNVIIRPNYSRTFNLYTPGRECLTRYFFVTADGDLKYTVECSNVSSHGWW